MKHFFLSLSLLFISCLAQAQYSKIFSVIQFENLSEQVNPEYGTKSKPLESGAFINMGNPQARNAAFVKLFNSYRWPNGDKINFSKRYSANGIGSKGIVDVYTLVDTGTKDTILLYVDPYKTSAKYEVPKGLIALNPAILKPEIEPVLQQIEELNGAEDGTKLKLHIGDIMSYISRNFDQNQLIDLNRLEFLARDKEADKDLTAYLMAIYLMNKYYALAKDLGNEADYAFEKMKGHYKRYLKAHPETSKGNLERHL